VLPVAFARVVDSPSSTVHVIVIFLDSARVQMRWVAARRVVASVKNESPDWDVSVREAESDDVRKEPLGLAVNSSQ